MDKRKLIILITVLIDVLGIGIIIPILPFYVKSFGAGPLTVTMLFAVFSFFSFFSAPILGAWSDKIGRRPILIISIFSTAIGWLVFAEASSLIFLFVGRIIDGLAAGNFSIAQNYLADIAKDEKERMANLGLIGGVFGVGFIIGPMLGGLLSAISPNFPFWFVGVLALLNGLGAILYLPETNHQKQADRIIDINPFIPIKRFLRQRNLRISFLAWFLFGLAVASQQAVLSLYVGDVFNFTVVKTGLMMTGVGIIISLNQALLLKNVWLKYFSQEILTLGGLLTMTAAFILIGIPWFLSFGLGLLLATFGQSILRITLTNRLVREGDVSRQGELMGVLTSIMSLAMIIGPLLAGLFYGFGTSYPFIMAALFMATAWLIMTIKKPQPITNQTLDEVILETAEQKMELA